MSLSSPFSCPNVTFCHQLGKLLSHWSIVAIQEGGFGWLVGFFVCFACCYFRDVISFGIDVTILKLKVNYQLSSMSSLI